ncbi:hypothetical protein [Streptomyces sp. NPDC005096]|uniref:hypothetical protein n=1 Tax=Streptomyces sp. NPDC005096 TaxID=3154559 RepID=UPI0033B4C2BD
MSVLDEQAALAWYGFIDARLDEELRKQYPTTDGTPAVEEYRNQYRAAKDEHQALVDALHRGDQDQAEDHLWGLRNQASKWKTHPEYPEPISDGTMPCPVTSDNGHPCTKRIPKGWAAAEGHGGGHFWQSPGAAELEARGAHYDPAILLSGQPTPWHMPEDCTPDCWKWSDR